MRRNSVAIDLHTQEGRETCLALARTGDVFVENFRPGTMERFKLGYEALRAVRPDIIYCSISGYGQTGPMASRPAFDLMIQAVSGLMSLTGDPGGRPVKAAAPVADVMGGFSAIVAIMGALMERGRTGEGRFLDISMLDGVIALMGQSIAGFRNGRNSRSGWATPIRSWLPMRASAAPTARSSLASPARNPGPSSPACLNLRRSRPTRAFGRSRCAARTASICSPRFPAFRPDRRSSGWMPSSGSAFRPSRSTRWRRSWRTHSWWSGRRSFRSNTRPGPPIGSTLRACRGRPSPQAALCWTRPTSVSTPKSCGANWNSPRRNSGPPPRQHDGHPIHRRRPGRRIPAACGVTTAFGIASVHNIPMLDAIGRRNAIRFVMARGEMGGAHMADGYARVAGGLGVCLSSTGPGAANAVGGLVEARFAGTPVLHITGQTITRLPDRDMGTVHDAGTSRRCSRGVQGGLPRPRPAQQAIGVLTPRRRRRADAAERPGQRRDPDRHPAHRDRAARRASTTSRCRCRRRCRRRGGARRAARARARRDAGRCSGSATAPRRGGPEAPALLDLGFGMVSSWNGPRHRPEDHPMNLGGLHGNGIADASRSSTGRSTDAGGRLPPARARDGDFAVKLPDNLVQIDVDPLANGRTYPSSYFVCGDAGLTLRGCRRARRASCRSRPGYPGRVPGD